MERRKFIIGAGALTAGSAAALGTGAFSSVTAERDVVVDVADDSDALLAIEETPNSSNTDYVTVDGDSGAFGIDVSSDNTQLDENPDGLNPDATTIIRSLVDITNQGTQPVLVWIEDQPDGIGFFADNFQTDRPDTGLGIGGQTNNAPLGDPRADLHYLKPGESLTDVGFYGEPTDAPTDSITLQAATVDEVYFDDLGEYDSVEQYDSPDDDADFDISDLEDVEWRDDD